MDHFIGPLQLDVYKKKSVFFSWHSFQVYKNNPLGLLIIIELILFDVAFVGANLCTWELRSPGCELGHSLAPSPVSGSMV